MNLLELKNQIYGSPLSDICIVISLKLSAITIRLMAWKGLSVIANQFRRT